MTPTTGRLAVARWWDEHIVPRLVDVALTDATASRTAGTPWTSRTRATSGGEEGRPPDVTGPLSVR